jgi:D-alanyl-D-alanine carboxypeptidase
VARIDQAGLGRFVTEFQTVNRRRCKNARTGGYIAGCVSKHSYGIAADIRPFDDNSRWKQVVAEEPGVQEVIDIFRDEGFRWGMTFAGNPDPQHVEWSP